MLSFRFHLSPADNDDEDFAADGVDFDGSPFTVTGRVSPVVHRGVQVLEVEWTVKYTGSDDVCYFGRLVDEFTIMGSRGVSVYDIDWSFVLKRVPAEYMLYRPSPYVLGHAPLSEVSLSPYSNPASMSTREGSMTPSILNVDIGETRADADEVAGTGDPETTAAAHLTDGGVGPAICASQEMSSDSASNSDIVPVVDASIAASADGQSVPDSHADVPTDQWSGGSESNSKYLALWRYAISAVLYDVRRKWWTWSYFAARREARKNFLNVHYAGLNGFFPHEPDHNARASQARLACTAADAQFYESLAIHLSNTRPDS